jgi:rubrerythrin
MAKTEENLKEAFAGESQANEGEPHDTCPICGSPKKMFKKIE